ncbi:MAG: hypothetical protein ACYTEQ_05600 [Planctomycetota bacterium]|jgi:hypothetical protein
MKVVIETTKGTKEAGTQALLVDELEIAPTAEFIGRSGPGKYLGHSEPGVIGALSGRCSFITELRGDGSSGLEPGLAILLQACKFKKALEVYNLHSDHADDKTISIDVWEDGKKKGLAGASGNVIIGNDVGKRMLCRFEFQGIWQAPVDEAVPAYAPSTTMPMMLKGATFTLDTQAIKIGSFELNTQNVLHLREDATAASGIAYCMITDYDPILTLTPEQDLVAGYDFHAKWVAGTEVAVSLVVNDGTDQVTFAIPKYQYRALAPGDRGGIATYDLTGQCNHDSGDDAVTLTAAAAA